MKVNSLKDITFDLIYDTVQEIENSQTKSYAAHGYSTSTIILYGKDGNERRSGVSMRHPSGTIEMLICDAKGAFIYYGKFHESLPPGFIAGEFYATFKAVYAYIETDIRVVSIGKGAES